MEEADIQVSAKKISTLPTIFIQDQIPNQLIPPGGMYPVFMSIAATHPMG